MGYENFPEEALSKMFHHNTYQVDSVELRKELSSQGAIFVSREQIDETLPNDRLRKIILGKIGVAVGFGTIVKGTKIDEPLARVLEVLDIPAERGTGVVTLLDPDKYAQLEEMVMLEALGHIGEAISAIALIPQKELLQ